MFRLDFLGGILYGIFANGIFWWDSFEDNVFCAIVLLCDSFLVLEILFLAACLWLDCFLF